MFEIAGGILLATFVLVFFRVFLALGMLLVACVLIGLLIYFFDLDWVLHFIKLLLMNPVVWGFGVLAFFGHLMFKKTDKLQNNVQANHILLYALQALNAKVKGNEIDYKVATKKNMLYRYYHEVDVGHFWVVYEKYQYSFSNHMFEPRIKILDSDKVELFSIGRIEANGCDMLSYFAKKIDFDYVLLGKEIVSYLAGFDKKDK